MNKQSESEDIEKQNEQNEHKNIRHRKRKFYNLIREQMEFYFGNANLLKDRFLMQLIKKDPFVPLEIFLKFNKMKKLVNSIDDIGKSLSNSKFLELNDDKTKVRRISELPDNQNNDSDIRTIYVEGIPSTADHDSLKKVFSHISGGKVVYVSLPKYKKSRKIKEFGFIEFEDELCVEKCLKTFRVFNGVLGTENVDPSELTSIKTFIKEQNDEIEDNTDKISKDNLKLSNKDQQHKHSSQSESDSIDSSGEPASKRPKLLKENKIESNVDDKNVNLEEIKCHTEENKKSDEIVDTTTDADDTATENKNENVQTSNRKRKKKKMHKTIKKELLNSDLNIQQLKILQKKDWKRLRNKYLNMQREIIADLKRKNWEKNCGQHQQQNNNLKSKNNKKLSSTTTSTIISQPSTAHQVKKFEIIKSPHHMNFYMVNKDIDGNTDDDDNNDKLKKSHPELITKNKKPNENLTTIKNTIKSNEPIRNLADEKSPLFNYEPGIIVNINFLEPCLELKNFKSDMKQYDFVKYVDIKEGALEAHIRCDSNKMAQELCKKIQSAEYNCKILSGDAEKLYWSKIMQDREMKLNKTVKIKTKRGREKIPKIITNHIRFCDDE